MNNSLRSSKITVDGFFLSFDLFQLLKKSRPDDAIIQSLLRTPTISAFHLRSMKLKLISARFYDKNVKKFKIFDSKFET